MEPEPLDRLLAEPPLLADHGFTDGVSRNLQRRHRLRWAVFGAMAAGWLLLAFAMGSLAAMDSVLDAAVAVLNPADVADMGWTWSSSESFRDPKWTTLFGVVAFTSLMAVCSLLASD